MKIRYLAIVMTLALMLALPAVASANSASQAIGPLHANTDYSGTLSTIVDENWYVFYSPSVQQLVLSSFTTGASGSQCLFVIGPGGDWEYCASGSSPVANRYMAIKQGVYYVRIKTYSQSSSQIGPYKFRLVPSSGFVTQTCNDALQGQAAAQQAITDAQKQINNAQGPFNDAQAQVVSDQGAVNYYQAVIGQSVAAIAKTNASITKYTAARGFAHKMMRREALSGRGPKWHAWQRKYALAMMNLGGAQRKLKQSQTTLASARTQLASAQSALANDMPDFLTAQATLTAAQTALGTAQQTLNGANTTIAQQCQAI